MIYTCTLNPSIDYVVRVEQFIAGGLNRAVDSATFAGGKGINVSRVLRRLGVENIALGFVGGFTGDFIVSELDKEEIGHRFVQVSGNTRINVKLKSESETEINGQGPKITTQESEELASYIRQMAKGDVLLLAGSIPSSLPADFYAALMTDAKSRGVKVVVDTSGPALKELIAHEPFLIKPNHHELGELFDTTVESKEHAMQLAKRLVENGVTHVIVSMAGEGALYVGQDTVLAAIPPKGKVQNSVGAGDSMIAGFLAQFEMGASIEEAFRYSVATGSATAFSEDLCTKDKVEELTSQVQISRVE
ncbi:MAG TPA: 1-phosphofructokinase [Chondromyces sp.]|nr:1-phosphofructokinase [Chondromyces sp.]